MLSGPVLVLYVAAAAIAFVLLEANDRISAASGKEKALPPALIALLTFVSNLLGVVSLVLLANRMSTGARLTMLGVPLLLVVERYGLILWREPQKRGAAAAGFAGSVAGLFAGAVLFLRHAASAEPVAHVSVPGDVPTMALSSMMENRGGWSVSLKLIVFYVVSIAIFFALHAVVKNAALRLTNCPEDKRRQRSALATLLAFALNFGGVAVLIALTNSADVQARLAMVGVPLFLIAESYVKLLRDEPQNRPSYWSGLIGSGGGMILAAFFLLRGAPLH
ncbi:MAG: hypothetical protein ACHQ49_11500 [Elusimicrobiota bacterium]